MSRTAKAIAAAILLVAIAGATGCSSSATIKTATATKTSLKVTVAASGKISAGDRTEVYPPAAGTLAEVYVKDGQTVKAGQRLAQMDTAPLRMQVKQAEAGVEQAEAGLSTLSQQTPSCADLAAANAAVTAAQAQYDNAKTAYSFAKNPPAPLPSNPTSIAIASANLKQARAGLLSARATVVKVKKGRNVGEQRDSADAAIDAAQAALDVAKQTLADATLVAPIDGTVFLNPVGVAGADGKAPLPAAGVGVAPQSAPFTVARLGTSTFTAEVDEADIDRVKLGMTADVTLDAFPGETFHTTVVHINPAAQPTATGGTIFEVELALQDTGKSVLLGMKGDATIQVSAVTGALTIPVEALFNQNGQNFVYKVVNGKLQQTNITVGATTDTSVEVLQGLSDGDVVAKAGATQYTNGLAVKVQN
ncbi:MAG TPA: efflux RND transporter periplasmic adaptor subunit [Coriobacteriia bacterium]